MDYESAPKSMTIKQWCAAENISLATYFANQNNGTGPVTVKIPKSNIVRIVESRESYHKRMMALAETKAEQKARKRRDEQRRAAAQASVASPKHISKQKTRPKRR
jgi:hypothetical protein